MKLGYKRGSSLSVLLGIKQKAKNMKDKEIQIKTKNHKKTKDHAIR